MGIKAICGANCGYSLGLWIDESSPQRNVEWVIGSVTLPQVRGSLLKSDTADPKSSLSKGQ